MVNTTLLIQCYNLCCGLVGELCRSKKIFFHTDAAQAVGKIPVDVNDMKIDLMSISGHKLYGPKGKGVDTANLGL